MKLAPSILSADFANLLDDVKKIENGGADLIHVDVMDGHFVPNISFGAPVMKCLTGKTSLPFDVHLMIENPDKYIDDFVTPQTEYITVHEEVLENYKDTIEHIKSHGIKAAVSINPETPVEVLNDYLPLIDMILIMSVHPGFGGQKYIPECLDKVKYLAKLREENHYAFEIEIDGGINLDNVKSVVEAGCDIVVAGSAVFKAKDVVNTVKEFKNK